MNLILVVKLLVYFILRICSTKVSIIVIVTLKSYSPNVLVTFLPSKTCCRGNIVLLRRPIITGSFWKKAVEEVAEWKSSRCWKGAGSVRLIPWIFPFPPLEHLQDLGQVQGLPHGLSIPCSPEQRFTYETWDLCFEWVVVVLDMFICVPKVKFIIFLIIKFCKKKIQVFFFIYRYTPPSP